MLSSQSQVRRQPPQPNKAGAEASSALPPPIRSRRGGDAAFAPTRLPCRRRTNLQGDEPLAEPRAGRCCRCRPECRREKHAAAGRRRASRSAGATCGPLRAAAAHDGRTFTPPPAARLASCHQRLRHTLRAAPQLRVLVSSALAGGLDASFFRPGARARADPGPRGGNDRPRGRGRVCRPAVGARGCEMRRAAAGGWGGRLPWGGGTAGRVEARSWRATHRQRGDPCTACWSVAVRRVCVWGGWVCVGAPCIASPRSHVKRRAVDSSAQY